MNSRAKILPLVIALSVLSAQALMATDDPKKKQAAPPPKAQPQAQPQAQQHAQPQAQQHAQPQAQQHAQPQAQQHAQPQAQQRAQPPNRAASQAPGKKPSALPKGSTTRPGMAAGGTHPQPGRSGPMPKAEAHARIEQINRAHPNPEARVHAHESYRAERTHFTRTMAPFRLTREHGSVLRHVHIVPGTYYYRRNAFYETYGWATPEYVYAMNPRYGLWDAPFLAFALNHVADEQYAMMMYHHWAEPEMQQWLNDTNRAAAQNPELRARVDALNERISRFENSGLARDPNYVPPDAQDLALSPDAVDQLTKK
jgi:hypothetical protein